MDIRQVFLDTINKTLDNLEWQCKGCLRMEGCEELDSNGKGKRYCREILDSAILGKRRFEYVKECLADQTMWHCEDCSHLNETGNPTWCASCRMSNFYPKDLPI